MYIFNFLPLPNFKFDTSISSKVQNQTFCRISISLVAKVTQIRKSFKLKNYLVESGLGGNVWVASGPSDGDDGDGDDDCDDDDVWLVSEPSDGGSNWVESGTRVLEYSLHYIVVSTWEYILSSHYSRKTRIER